MAAEDTKTDPEQIESVDRDEANVLLADPDDYHQSQRLREIHERRRQVHNVLDDIERWSSRDDHNLQRMKLADAVASYITELEPLLEQTDHEIDPADIAPFESLSQYADRMGRYPKEFIEEHDLEKRTRRGKKVNATTANYEFSLRIFRACNKFLSDVKPLITEDEDEPGYLDL